MISTWFGNNPSVASLDRTRLLFLRCDARTRIAIAKATRGVDLRPSFSEQGPPTLILCGIADRTPRLKQTKRIAAAIAGADLKIIDTAGHMLIVEQPKAVIDQLLDWLPRC